MGTAFRTKRNTRWTQKLSEIFNKWDVESHGSLGLNEVKEIYRIYKVDLKEDVLRQRMDNNGRINRANFVILSMEAKLVDFTESTNDRRTIQRGGRKLHPERSKDKEEREENDKEYIEQIEAAFMKLDLDKDGFIDWNEFQQVAKHVDLNQARRIFETCDESGDEKISLDEF